MLQLLDLIFGIGEMLFSWRLYLVLFVTGGIMILLLDHIHEETLQWLLGVPAGAVGIVPGFWWQWRADH